MFKFDKFTAPYYISNIIFYVFTLIIIGLIYWFAFLPPILDVGFERMFANMGIREVFGLLFFSLLIIVPLLVLWGIIHHTIKLLNIKNQVAYED